MKFPPLTLFVTAVTVASSAPLSQISHNLFLSKKKAADAKGYLVDTKSGFLIQSSPMNQKLKNKKKLKVIMKLKYLKNFIN